MKIKTVRYERLFPVGAYLNEKIGFEAELDEPYLHQPEGNSPQWLIETPEYVINHLRQLAENIHKEKYPHLYTESGTPIVVRQVEEVETTTPRQEKIEGMKSIIKLCSTQSFLEKQRKNVEELNDPELWAAFEEKLQSLQK